jgi:nucleoid-associated protein YgaU
VINAASRYAQSSVVTLLGPDGQPRQVIVSGQQIPFVIRYTYHQVTSGDRIDQIAFTYYQDASRWWVIADANPEILDYSTLTPGYLLRVPIS